MPNRVRWIVGAVLFVAAGLVIFTFANPGDPTTDDPQVQEQIDDATAAVEDAESSLLQNDVDTARDLVNALEDGATKTDLSDRLDAVQDIIDATNAVETAEGSGLTVDVNGARLLVNALPDSSAKTALLGRLDAIDVIAPIITVLGANPVTIALGSTYTDLGVTAIDAVDGNVTASVVRTGIVNTLLLGTYTLTYTVSDASGNVATATRSVNVTDQTIPVITIIGANPMTIAAGSSYTELGATATDNVNGTITASIVRSGSVNPLVVGTYTITYRVSDASGNDDVATRTVYVTDQTAPTVVFDTNGNSTYAKNYSTTVTVSDMYGVVNPSTLKYLWTISNVAPLESAFGTLFTNGATIDTPLDVTGSYYLWILAKDSALNTTIAGSNLFNLDNEKPVISITGGSPYYIDVCVSMGCTYSDLGAIATDNIDGDLSSMIVTTGTVDPWRLGSYTITYTVSDALSNETTVDRTVIVRPRIWFDANSDTEYEFTHHTHVNVFAGWSYSKWELLNTTSFMYLWTTSMEQPAVDSFINTFTPLFADDVRIDSPIDLNGTYYLWVMGSDIYGNKTFKMSGAFNFDNIAPLVSFNTNGNSTYAKTHSTIVTVLDTLSGVDTNPDVLEYYWTKNSSLTEPSDFVFHSDFSSGDTINTPTHEDGVWYLWVKAYDIAGNSIKIRSNGFYIDNDDPEVSFSPSNGGPNYHLSYNVTVTVNDDLSGVDPSSLKYLWKNTPGTPSVDDFSSSFVSGDSIGTPMFASGSYYLWILAKDNAGNVEITSSGKFKVSTPM